MFSSLKEPTLILFPTSCELSSRTGILIFAFNLTLIVKLGLNFWKCLSHLAWCNLNNFHPSKTSGSFQAVSHLVQFLSRAFQAPLKSKIKFQGFSRTSRSSTNPVQPCVCKVRSPISIIIQLSEKRVSIAVFILETHNPSRRIMRLSCYSSSVKTGRTM